MVNDNALNILFVSNLYPFPPRDGVTVPFCNYAQLFKKHGGSVDLLVLNSGHEKAKNNENQQFFRNVYELSIRPTGLVNRVGNQLLGRSPYFSGWQTASALPASLSERTYRTVVSTPRAVMAVVDQLRRQKVINATHHVAAVNDIATLAKKNLAKSALRNGLSRDSIARYSKHTLQRIGLKSSELNLLSNHCDLFIVQSSAESGWITIQDSKKKTSLAEKMIQLANGVDEIFFDVPTTKTARTCTFVGVVASEYLQRVEWLVDKVWGPVQARYPDAKFTVSGRCLNQRMLEKFEQAQVVHRNFVEDPRDLFADQQVLLAPIFKGYGLINKVVQSMAAGTLVIGDATAFNAIPEFEAGKHGLVAGNRGEFVELLTQVFINPEKTRDIQRAARTLIHKHFQWEERFQDLQQKLNSISKKDRS